MPNISSAHKEAIIQQHRGSSIGLLFSHALEAILMYNRYVDDRNTKQVTLQEFQAFIVQFIPEFISFEDKYARDRRANSKNRNTKDDRQL